MKTPYPATAPSQMTPSAMSLACKKSLSLSLSLLKSFVRSCGWPLINYPKPNSTSVDYPHPLNYMVIVHHYDIPIVLYLLYIDRNFGELFELCIFESALKR
jgi:hypothetical protein